MSDHGGAPEGDICKTLSDISKYLSIRAPYVPSIPLSALHVTLPDSIDKRTNKGPSSPPLRPLIKSTLEETPVPRHTALATPPTLPRRRVRNARLRPIRIARCGRNICRTAGRWNDDMMRERHGGAVGLVMCCPDNARADPVRLRQMRMRRSPSQRRSFRPSWTHQPARGGPTVGSSERRVATEEHEILALSIRLSHGRRGGGSTPATCAVCGRSCDGSPPYSASPSLFFSRRRSGGEQDGKWATT